MSDMTMGQRIAEQRKKLGLSQEALGEKLGVSRQAISKWESDGTVPEIDKLIGLSRLFSVSVGWLLGVEENVPAQPDELTESQLKMVEEIVKRYQHAPEPEEKGFQWFPLVLAFLFLFPIVYFLFNQNKTDYSGQISSLQANYRTIQSQLQSLSGQVEDIVSAAEESDKLLQSHEFKLLELSEGGHSLDPVSEKNLTDEELQKDAIPITVDVPTAELHFSAVVKQRAESDRAWLVVLLNGQPMGQVECIWSGAGYTAEFSLWLEDGYEYRFVVEHADGTQQIQMLEEYEYCDLAYNTTLHCYVDAEEFHYNPQHWTLDIGYCHVEVVKPSLSGFPDTRWTQLGLKLYRNGTEIQRYITADAAESWDGESQEVYQDLGNLRLDQVKLEEGDRVKLTFYAALDNGMEKETDIGCWTLQGKELIPD